MSDIGTTQSSAIDVKDFYSIQSNIIYVAGGDKLNYLTFNNSSSLSSNSNFSVPLDANAIVYTDAIYVGTEHGIYKTGSRTNFTQSTFEWQPSSLNDQINELWNQSYSNYTYACANNGVLL